uniref:Transposase n=4 Tax=Candidatus Kentrum eta TaxID=2126337 RepID=A0A450VGQ4_9GAMM|nr:MAG: Transposase [Candidatus Kentron sp. H]
MKNLSGRSHNILNIRAIMDDARCFCAVRELRWWPEGIRCTHCQSDKVVRHGHDETHPERQRYHCGNCNGYFDDLTGTIFRGHHRALSVWILCLYFMGLNLSNSQIARELELNISDVQERTGQLRQGVVARKPCVKLHGEVECDEVYVLAGHKGQPKAVQKKP